MIALSAPFFAPLAAPFFCMQAIDLIELALSAPFSRARVRRCGRVPCAHTVGACACEYTPNFNREDGADDLKGYFLREKCCPMSCLIPASFSKNRAVTRKGVVNG